MTAGTLFLVGTPIGHPDDITERARRTLAAVPVVACEDSRTAGRLFATLALSPPEFVVYHDHNARAVAPGLLDRIAAGEDLALISDAGMPAVQDPGYRLVTGARARGLKVVPVPGPSALLLAVAASGLPTDRFAFLGYAPRKGREAWWRSALSRGETVIVYESPRRIPATAGVVAAVDPDRPVCLARELTKVHEEFVGGRAADVATEMAGRASVRGECVLVVGGADAPAGGAVPWPEALAAMDGTRIGPSLSARDRVELLACAYPGERNAIYRAILEGAEGPA